MRRVLLAAVPIALVGLSFVTRAAPSHTDPVHEVQVVAKQFAFDPAVIQVTPGEPVRLVIRSDDRVHGFAIPELNIDAEIPRGGSVVVEFTAPRAGRYEIACSEFCGREHARMKAVLVSVAATPAAEHDRFAAESRAAMTRMMSAMDVARPATMMADFAAMTIAHHTGAIEMSKAELQAGQNAQLRRLAEEIIVTQQQEIAVMRLDPVEAAA